MTSRATDTLAQVLTGAYLRRSIYVTLIVGTILNLINQWDAGVGGAPIVWTKVVLTYCVPFCVSTYGAFSALRADSQARAGRSPD